MNEHFHFTPFESRDHLYEQYDFSVTQKKTFYAFKKRIDNRK